MYALAIVLLITLLSLCAYKFLQEKRSAVPRKYDVFLSFRGADTRTGFTDFLYHSLKAAGIRVFRDDEALPEIMGCHETRCSSVFPVFYNVNVPDVHRPQGCFEEAFEKHERECSAEKVRKWRKAMFSVTKIWGWRSSMVANGHEGELVKMVVTKVSSELSTTWIERLPTFIRSVDPYFSEKKIRESECQVFLSYRACDARNGIVDYLYVSLVAAGIKAFYDAEPSHIGKDVESMFRDAINQCKISIVILSVNYASSNWCLKQLVQIVECKSRKGQNIIPVFYKVSPSHVKDQSDRFREELIEHKHWVNESTYERWVQALEVVRSSAGFVSEKIANGHEGVLVKQVVQKASSMLKNPQAHDP